jgi:hypothetical protein
MGWKAPVIFTSPVPNTDELLSFVLLHRLVNAVTCLLEDPLAGVDQARVASPARITEDVVSFKHFNSIVGYRVI